MDDWWTRGDPHLTSSGERGGAKGESERKRRRRGRKEGMNSKEVSEPERFHSGNRFLIVERNMASPHRLPYSRNMSLRIWISTRIIARRSSISFCFCWLNDSRKRLLRRYQGLFEKFRLRINFDHFRDERIRYSVNIYRYICVYFYKISILDSILDRKRCFIIFMSITVIFYAHYAFI